ncbi:MAG: SUMF1/EgtB/PvdO family nonheme iron enzyme [Elusimicrobia bacterium]|nr:SUMF1/EgtB/PvdO family nonheme iron enzyme [Elusimicrobiota bacterium]
MTEKRGLSRPRLGACILLAAAAWCGLPRQGGAASWPDVGRPAASVGGGEADAAVIVGIERYAFVSPVRGAGDNARAWYDYLTKTRGLKPANVRLLLESDGTLEEIRAAAEDSAGRAAPGGTLWFVFIGHGAPGGDAKDGVLVGVDAQQKAASLYARSLPRAELLRRLGTTKAGQVNVILDACFSGRTEAGALIEGLQPLVLAALAPPKDDRFLVMTAAKGNQFAGPLPGSKRPAFSYLTLGALRGWADSNHDGKVTAGEVFGFVDDALRATLRGRDQTPELTGKADALIGASAGEGAPDLAVLAKESAGRSTAEMFQISELPVVPTVEAPQALAAETESADWRDLDVDALEKYDAAIAFDKGSAGPDQKAANWLALAQASPQFADKADRRAEEWKKFSEAQKAAEETRRKRAEARDKDWSKLRRLLSLSVIPEKDKKRWALMFVQAYGKTAVENPYLSEITPLLPSGTVSSADLKIPTQQKGRADIVWISIPGGEFMMGSEQGGAEEKPVHRVRVRPFQLSKTEVTLRQYKECVAAGACEAIDANCTTFGAAKINEFMVDELPAVCMTREQAQAFAKWAGGRLPTEAEWEFAARGGGQDWKFPWGNDPLTCDHAVTDAAGDGCGRNTPWPPCSKRDVTTHGVCDMAGNVWELVADTWHENYSGAPDNGDAWIGGGSGYNTVRGGVWRYGSAKATTTHRESGSRDTRLGFRLAR